MPGTWPPHGTGRADVICLFTAFYAFPDQARALAQMRAAAAGDATLVMFDYTCPPFDARLGGAESEADRARGSRCVSIALPADARRCRLAPGDRRST